MGKGNKEELSKYLSYILRHEPWAIDLDMDTSGWVDVQEMLDKIDAKSPYKITKEELNKIVNTDKKSRYKFNEDKTRIKACQGHSISWVTPELLYKEPPSLLYHGTTMDAYNKILKSEHIDKMERHAVHLQAEEDKAKQSAKRWKNGKPVLLVIDASKMVNDGYKFGVTDNNVWCTEMVPCKYIKKVNEL